MSEVLKQAVIAAIDKADCGDVYRTDIEGLLLMRSPREKLPNHMLYKPALCVVVQGAKQLALGEQRLDYAEMQCLVVSVELPAAGRVTKASPERPYYGINLDLDPAMMRSVLAELQTPPVPNGEPVLGVFVGETSQALVDCLIRLIRLLDNPAAIPVLASAVMREICFWLLTGPYGAEVCKVATEDSHMRRISTALNLLRTDFSRSIHMEELADAARMSLSSFYEHFKTATAMTPLQYQKQLRLLEARRLMLIEDVNVAEAAYQVGYESPSQFSRDYARMFGTAPKRDVTGLRSSPVATDIAVGAG